MEIEDVRIGNTSEVIQGDTWVEVTVINNKEEKVDYNIDIAWTKFPEKYRLEEAYVARVQEIKQGSDKWYEEDKWWDIPGWEEIENAAMKKFEEEMGI